MRILAIDTSCDAASICLYDSQKAKVIAARSERMTRGHAEAIGPMAAQIRAECGAAFDTLDRVAVTLGPGSFTGIRVGVAFARAIGLSLGIQVVGISTLITFAGQLFLTPRAGLIASVIDARHGNVYFQFFDSGGRALMEPRIDSIGSAVRAAGVGLIRVTGAGAGIFAAEALRLGIALDESSAVAAPDTVTLARLAAVVDAALCAARPIYLKAPDALVSAVNSVARVNP